MTAPTSSAALGAHIAARAIRRALAAIGLLLGGILTIGALWLPWRHYAPPGDTSAIDPRDLAPYIPIADGWAHSFLVFTIAALATGVLAWLAASRGRAQAALAPALGSILCAAAGVLFASVGIDGARLWRGSEVADVGYYVCLLGYLCLITAGCLFITASGRRLALAL